MNSATGGWFGLAWPGAKVRLNMNVGQNCMNLGIMLTLPMANTLYAFRAEACLVHRVSFARTVAPAKKL